MFEPFGIGGDLGGNTLLSVIGIIAVALFIFHTNRKLYNDHSKSKRPPRDRGSKLKGSPARFKSADNPLSATTTTMSAGTAKAQGD